MFGGRLCLYPNVADPLRRSAQALAPRACQPQGLEYEAYLNSTSQGLRPEDARKDDHVHGRSSRYINNPG